MLPAIQLQCSISEGSLGTIKWEGLLAVELSALTLLLFPQCVNAQPIPVARQPLANYLLIVSYMVRTRLMLS